MRAILFNVIMAVLFVIAPFAPVIGLYSYVWFSLLRPDVLAFAYGEFPYSSVIAGLTLLGFLRYLHTAKNVFSSPITIGMMVLQIPMYLSVLFAVNKTDATSQYGYYIRMVLMCLVIPMLITTGRDLWRLVMVMGASLGFLGSKFGLGGIIHGGVRYVDGYGGMLSDNNQIALAFAMTVPIMWCLRRDVESWMWRMLLAVMSFFTLAGLIMTHSRGGAVTVVAVLILLVLRSRRKLGLLLAFAAATAPVVYLVRDSYVERMQTITDEDESSISMRLALAKTALEMWKDSPVVGFGFGGRSSIRQAREYQSDAHGSVFHDTYLQVLVDSGVPALVVWVSLLWGTILWLEFSRRKARSNLPHLANIPEAIQLSLIAFAIGSAFLSRVQFDFTYMLLAAAASWGMVYRKEMAALREEAADSVQPATLETAPVLN